jgi:hypothetical protein
MSISFEFENTLSLESPIYPLIADLSGTVTLYPMIIANRYESKDFPIYIAIDIRPESYHMSIGLISHNRFEAQINKDVPYNDSVMKCLTKIEKAYNNININSPNRYHPLYQLLEGHALRYDSGAVLWKDYIFVSDRIPYDYLIMITLGNRVIYKFIYDYNSINVNPAKELVEKIDAGLMDELLVQPLTSKSARN